MAYHITATREEEVRSYLDLREINGYTIHTVPFYPAGAREAPWSTMVYIGTPQNAQFVGPQDPAKLAEHILKSRGPSGENREYLFKLEESLTELSPDSGDDHVQDLAKRARETLYTAPEDNATSTNN